MMAKPGRIDNKQFTRERAKNKRFTGTKSERKYYLIVCEGKKTEPNYFKCFENELPRGTVLIEIIGTGKAPLDIVNRAIKRRDEAVKQSKKNITSRPYDQVWVVFDKDNIDSDDFNEAIRKAEQNEILAAYSNEAFELWYLLHFDYHESAMSSDQYCGKLTECIGEKYQKNDIRNYKIMQEKGDEKQAIARAKRLYNKWDHASPAKENPSTTVFRLVEELNKHKS